MDIKYKKSPILVSGDGRLLHSISVCLTQAEHPVTLITNNRDLALKSINDHFACLAEVRNQATHWGKVDIKNGYDCKPVFSLAIAITSEDIGEKKAAIQQLEGLLPADAIIAINTESIPLTTLQEVCRYPSRLIGLNWVEPAHTTYFLELITNDKTDKERACDLFNLAKSCWNKDPYLVSNDMSIRAKMLGVMAREAFYLVENGYASIEDIDRACRNDPGYYLPFSGNFRYMDLMGTYAYGLVMKDLNRELSREGCIPGFFEDIMKQGGLGMENNKGFYEYEEGDVEQWKDTFSKFSYQIKEIINKYPFNYRERTSMVDHKQLK